MPSRSFFYTRTNVHHLCKEPPRCCPVYHPWIVGHQRVLLIQGWPTFHVYCLEYRNHVWNPCRVLVQHELVHLSTLFNLAIRFIVKINAGKHIPFCIDAFLRKAAWYSQKTKKKGAEQIVIASMAKNRPKKTNCTMAPNQNFLDSCDSNSINE